MDQGSTNNKLLQTLTDSIPESLVKTSPPGFTSVGSASSSGDSSFFNMLMSSWIIIGVVVICLAFFVIYLLHYYYFKKNEEYDAFLHPTEQFFSNAYAEVSNAFSRGYDYTSHFFKDIYFKATNAEEAHEQPQVADGSQPFLKKQGDHPLESVPQTNNLQENIQPPNMQQQNMQQQHMQQKNMQRTESQTTKNPRQAAQFNQMPGINSGKRVGQHVAADSTQQSYNSTQDSLLSDLQNAAQGITNSNSYSADDANSSVQTKSKAGWCFIGQDNNTRNCIQVGMNDTCLSGDIFPTSDICVNPNLRT